uniref:Uncharacterized protein n=1 Tax=Meloidogyne enterolobii TaxID=390850 RepID=A0A6V7UXD6_MELEN|nr:unnamed protein product [Meloidogyne enterolobii]
MDTLRQKKRSRSQPGISLISTNQQKLEKNLIQQDVDFIETDCCCLAETSQTNATLLWSASTTTEAKGERNSIITISPQNKININGLSKSVVIIDRRKGGGNDRRNKDEEEEDNGNGGSCCSQDSLISTHSTGSLTTASSNSGGCIIEEIDSGIANLNCNGSEDKQILNQKQQCFCSNIATTSKVLPPFLHLISCNSKENGCGGVLFTAEAVFENVAMLRDELPFSPGDEVAVLDCPSDELWYGICGPRSGWFPAAYIRPKNRDLCRLFSSDCGSDSNCLINNSSTSCDFPSNEMRKLRRRIIQELVNTEREYVRLLEHLVMGFLEQCRRRRELFPEERILRIFGNLELIYSLHTNIFKELLNVLDEEKPESTCLANVFLKNSQQFGIYTDYCNNRTLSCTELAQLEQQSQYFHFFEACRLLRALPKLSLDAFLLTPVQRICRYPLQLLELLKATPPNHPDRLALELAQRTMKLIASKVNDGKRRVDAIQKIWLWQNSVHGFRGPNLIESNHRLLINGELQCRALWNGQLQWSKNGLIIYLFDQTIVLCKRDVLRRSNLIFKERMGMGGTTLYDLHDGKDPLTGTTLKNAFKLSGPAREYIFCCQDAATKSLWLEAIRNRPRPQPPSQAERRLAMLI